ncbi:MAG: flagellar biosynthetic protein FliR [bacterium]
MLENFLSVFKNFPEFSMKTEAGLYIMARFLGFVSTAPVFSRKDVPFMLKMGFTFLMSICFVSILNPSNPPPHNSMFLSILLNSGVGAIIGLIGTIIMSAVGSAGDIINMQMGLSSAVMFDPSSRGQTSIIGKAFTFLSVLIFIEEGGIYWLIAAFQRSFEIFPIYGVAFPLKTLMNLDYLIMVSSNVIIVGMQLSAPVLMATLAMDVILGIVSKTAPQVNVFQLSAMFKPVLGIAVLILTMPLLMNVLAQYFSQFSRIYP